MQWRMAPWGAATVNTPFQVRRRYSDGKAALDGFSGRDELLMGLPGHATQGNSAVEGVGGQTASWRNAPCRGRRRTLTVYAMQIRSYNLESLRIFCLYQSIVYMTSHEGFMPLLHGSPIIFELFIT